MDKKITDLGDALMALTTAEAVELQTYLESKGLKPAQPTVIAAPASQSAEEVKESENVQLVLIQKGGTNMKLIKAVTELTKKPAMEVKRMTDEIPAVIFDNIPRDTAKTYVSDLANELGAEYVFELKDC